MNNFFTRSYLFIAGLIMLLVGVYVAITTVDYVAALSPTNSKASINLLSDLRGMGGMLLVLGAYVFISSFYIARQQTALIIASTTYASFVLFRTLGFVLDGLPETEILVAYVIELVLAVIGIRLLKSSSNLYAVCNRLSNRKKPRSL